MEMEMTQDLEYQLSVVDNLNLDFVKSLRLVWKAIAFFVTKFADHEKV